MTFCSAGGWGGGKVEVVRRENEGARRGMYILR